MLAGSRFEILLGLEVRVALLLGRVARSLGRGHSRLGHSVGLGRCDGHFGASSAGCSVGAGGRSAVAMSN
eukprot:scaffold31288_cov36-Phaeocystis_antarctica.AAC.6